MTDQEKIKMLREALTLWQKSNSDDARFNALCKGEEALDATAPMQPESERNEQLAHDRWFETTNRIVWQMYKGHIGSSRNQEHGETIYEASLEGRQARAALERK